MTAVWQSRRSESTGRGEDAEDYQLIPSLQEYVLVSQEARGEVYRRRTGESWEYLDVREGVVKLLSGPTLDLSVLYERLPD